MRRTSAKSNHISIGFYGTHPNGKVITLYAEALRQILKEKIRFKWAEVGAHLLTPIVDQHLDSVFLFREDQIHPIVAENQELLAAGDKGFSDLIPDDAICLMLFHRIFESEVSGASLADATVQTLYHGNGLISKALRAVYPQKIFDVHFGRRRSITKVQALPEKAPTIATRYETDKLIERIGYWVPNGEFAPQESITPKTRLKVAAVLEERLYQGLRYEAHMMLLTPDNWKATLQYSKPDFLLMESIWTTATAHWHMGQCSPAPERNTLLSMVSLARQKGIPTVFWITKGHAYHEHYKHFARHFDFVFCADPEEVDKLRSEGIQTDLLLPCAQPAFYKRQPLSEAPVPVQSIPILFDGWADLDKMSSELNIFLKLKPLGLKIIESRYQVFRSRMKVLPEYKGHILGCVSSSGRLAALKDTTYYVTHDKTLSSKTTQQWLTLDAAAAGLRIVHFGKINADDPRKQAVIATRDETFFLDCLKINSKVDRSEGEDPNTLRLILEQHTFAHRLDKITHRIGIS